MSQVGIIEVAAICAFVVLPLLSELFVSFVEYRMDRFDIG